MRMFALMAASVIGLGITAIKVTAEEAKTDEKPAASQPASKPAIANKKCPITGEDVDPKGKTVAYKGKTVGFCCDECIEKFEKDPDKYAKDMK